MPALARAVSADHGRFVASELLETLKDWHWSYCYLLIGGVVNF